ncbi:hypothetical protein B5X24_HaOG213777 [Helicoverpa armigera]|uniref:Uncharacterized protein n=1 Tax=Helicoverpa armigera TaxID=29058 RepID=A0A2W1BBK9_HELAM|nr:hypothetical protein B5X24_HaOG213777 [Helicoverpa armigera]
MSMTKHSITQTPNKTATQRNKILNAQKRGNRNTSSVNISGLTITVHGIHPGDGRTDRGAKSIGFRFTLWVRNPKNCR